MFTTAQDMIGASWAEATAAARMTDTAMQMTSGHQTNQSTSKQQRATQKYKQDHLKAEKELQQPHFVQQCGGSKPDPRRSSLTTTKTESGTTMQRSSTVFFTAATATQHASTPTRKSFLETDHGQVLTPVPSPNFAPWHQTVTTSTAKTSPRKMIDRTPRSRTIKYYEKSVFEVNNVLMPITLSCIKQTKVTFLRY